MKHILIAALLMLFAVPVSAESVDPATSGTNEVFYVELKISGINSPFSTPVLRLVDGERQTVKVPDGSGVLIMEPLITAGSSSVSLDLIITKGNQVSRPLVSIPIGGSRTVTANNLTIVATVTAADNSKT